VLWSFLGQRRLFLNVHRRRLWCVACRRAFTQPLPAVGKYQRIGTLAGVAVLHALREQSFASLMRAWQVSYGRARRVLLRLPVPWCEWSVLLGNEGPIMLGIDEHSFRGNRLVITVVCLSTHQLVAILPNDRQETLRHYLRSMPQEVRGRLAGVCIDLKASFRTVLEQELPQARVVADHFHVIQDANRRLDATRRLEQGEQKQPIPRWPLVKGRERLSPKQAMVLEQTLARFASLREQHWIKERLRTLYHCPDPATALEHWRTTLLVMEASEDGATLQWARTLRFWRPQILAYFSLPITNGFTEGCHTKIKLLKRLSYGYRNIQVYIRKMLLGFLPTSFPTLAPHILT
jgi:transposase